MKLPRKTKETIEKHSMISGNERILVGLSGGPDSVCLLHILNGLKNELRIDLHALYIDHGLRPEETQREILFCKSLCQKLSVPFITKSIDVKSHAEKQRINRQEAARQLRYVIFEETAREVNAHKIALGHTADDQAETLLMRFFRGSGPQGLSGIPPTRERVIRPLIEIERAEIEAFIEEEKIDFVVDSSNLRKDYLRNRIRLSVIPALKEYNPNLIDTLSRTAAIFREEERYFEVIVAKTMMRLVSRKTDTRIELFLGPVEVMDTVILRRVLRRAVEETKSLRGVSFIHIEDIIELIRKGKAGDRIYLPGGVRAIKEYATFVLTSEPPARLPAYSFEVPGEVIFKETRVLIKASVGDRNIELKTGNAGTSTALAFFDADKVTFPLMVRSRKKGDFFYPLGFGKRKKLQDFFVDEKVPRDERDGVPLIISGEDIVWIAGYRGDERFSVGEETKRILKLEVRKV